MEFRMKKLILTKYTIFLIILTALSCSTVPKSTHNISDDMSPLKELDIVTIISNQYSDDTKHTAALNTGVVSKVKSPKVIVDLPNALAGIPDTIINDVLSSDLSSRNDQDLAKLLNLARKAGSFNAVLLVSAKKSTVTISIFGIPITSQPGVVVQSALYNVDKKKFVAASREASTVNEQTEILDLTQAGSSAVECLAHK
jgi:hypothetical protein